MELKVKNYKTAIQAVDKIIHISDIHIRTLQRHKEYKIVFDNLFEFINTTATTNTICVITGDIVHSKLDLSPELVNLLIDFFNGFKIPTIVILGNHDMNLNNSYRIDAISPVLNVLENKNIIFVKENGTFIFGDILFNHMAVDCQPSEYVNLKDITVSGDVKHKIALHHGAVNGAKSDTGWKSENNLMNVDFFEGHDYVLLGDIHKPAQFLNKERTIGYPGSLIQQNHGEVLDHGILVWDLEKGKVDFQVIKNDYGYVTFEVEGQTILSSPHRMPERARTRIKFKDTSAADMKSFITKLRKKFKIEDISIHRVTDKDIETGNANITIGNVRDVEYQNTLITEYIENNHPQVLDTELDAIRHINRTINSKLPVLEVVRNVTWHPVLFEWSNMFSYGENNIVDFNNLKDIIGLFAANTAGKSSFLDAITYTIFDKCSKTGKAKEVLNNKRDTFSGKFVFRMNDIEYTIIREGFKLKSGHVKVNVEFYTESENLNGEERSDTNKNIRRFLGTYDDFILTAFSLQTDNNNFIERSQRERKDLLSQFLDIIIFEQLYILAAEDIKETAGKLKEYKKTDFGLIIQNAEKIINENKNKIIDLDEKELKLQEERNDTQNEILRLIESKQPTTYDGPDIEELQNDESILVEKNEGIQTEIEEYEDSIESIATEISILYDKKRTYNESELQNNQQDSITLATVQEHISSEYSRIKGIIDAKQQKIDHLKTHEYDPDCRYCMSNVFVQDATQAKATIEKDREVLATTEKQYNDINLNIEELEPKIKLLEEFNELKRKILEKQNSKEKQELQLQILENDLQTKEAELETNLERQDSFIKNGSAIKFNKIVDKKITENKISITLTTEEIKKINNTIKSRHGEIEVAKTKKQHAEDQLLIYKELEIEYKAYEYYLESVKRNGVPYDLITKALPKIEHEINNVLNNIVDFNMVLNTDGKNINGYIIYDEDNFWKLESTSGMERFVSSLAIRVALINVSALPRPNFIAIDEGWGSLDTEHITAVVNLFEYFRNKFDFSLIISHVDSMRDMVDDLIEVNKIDNFSQINHT